MRFTHFNQLPNQEQIVLRHLLSEGSITSGEAQMVHRIRSLSRRITSLLDAGIVVEKDDRRDSTGQRYRRYTLRVVPPNMLPPEEPYSQVAA